MVECLDPLENERGKNCSLFVLGNLAMNASRENDANVERHRPICDQATYYEIYDLPGRRLPRCVGNNDQNTLARLHDFL